MKQGSKQFLHTVKPYAAHAQQITNVLMMNAEEPLYNTMKNKAQPPEPEFFNILR